MKRILLITNLANREATTAQGTILSEFTERLNKLDETYQYGFCAVQDLIFEVTTSREIHIWLHGKELAETYDVLHLRNMQKFTDYANALRIYAEHKGISIVNVADVTLPYYGKVSQGMVLALHDIPTPAYLSCADNQLLADTIVERDLSYPLIIKHNEGIKGNDNYLVRSSDHMQEVLSQDKHHFVAQPFIANDGELRVLTFGFDATPMIFKKQAVEGSHLNNTSKGGNAELVDVTQLPDGLLDDAMNAAKATNRAVSGVDVLLAKDGTWCILEVNSTPQIATGAYTDEKVTLYHQYFVNGENI